MDLILLIRRMSQENVTWGAPRIVAELALLGHVVAESTVAKYMGRSPAATAEPGLEVVLPATTWLRPLRATSS